MTPENNKIIHTDSFSKQNYMISPETLSKDDTLELKNRTNKNRDKFKGNKESFSKLI